MHCSRWDQAGKWTSVVSPWCHPARPYRGGGGAGGDERGEHRQQHARGEQSAARRRGGRAAGERDL